MFCPVIILFFLDNFFCKQDLVDSKTDKTVGEAKTGDIVGEIGVLCYRPQAFTVRTKRLSQLLRLNRTSFLNIIQANIGDGTIIMNNLLRVRIQKSYFHPLFIFVKYSFFKSMI